MNALELNRVCKQYDTFALDQVSFTLPRGYIMGFIGENGAGKTTTIKAILGLVHYEGDISVLGRPQEEITAVKEQVGVVLEEATFPELLNARDINSILSGVYKTWDAGRFTSLLQRFALEEKKRIKDYSRGMKMKLALAVALAHDSQLLILDEPTSGLDPVVREEVLDMLLEFIQNPSHSILISSHILSDLERICDYITFIHKGRILLSLPKEELNQTYGIYQGSEEALQRLPKEAILGLRRGQFGCQALVLREAAGNLPLEPAELEETMVLMIKGGK